MNKRKIKHVILFLFASILFFSCDRGRIFEKNQDIPETGWKADNVLKFDVDIKDPATPTNFYINVRNADGYPYGNIFLFIKTKFPNGKMSDDTLECILADEKGKFFSSANR